VIGALQQSGMIVTILRRTKPTPGLNWADRAVFAALIRP
jgi:hypothetical protein